MTTEDLAKRLGELGSDGSQFFNPVTQYLRIHQRQHSGDVIAYLPPVEIASVISGQGCRDMQPPIVVFS